MTLCWWIWFYWNKALAVVLYNKIKHTSIQLYCCIFARCWVKQRQSEYRWCIFIIIIVSTAKIICIIMAVFVFRIVIITYCQSLKNQSPANLLHKCNMYKRIGHFSCALGRTISGISSLLIMALTIIILFAMMLNTFVSICHCLICCHLICHHYLMFLEHC